MSQLLVSHVWTRCQHSECISEVRIEAWITSLDTHWYPVQQMVQCSSGYIRELKYWHNLSPDNSYFWQSSYIRLIKTLWRKKKILVTRIFSFFHYVFYPIKGRNLHFSCFLFVVCKCLNNVQSIVLLVIIDLNHLCLSNIMIFLFL